MARLKTYGINATIPQGWPTEATPNSAPSRLAIVAAESIEKALDAFHAAGLTTITRNYFNGYGYRDMGGAAETVSKAEPGRVFYSPHDPTRGTFNPAPASD